MSNMMEIQKRAALRAIQLLAAAGCKYKVICPDGDEFGELEVVQPKQRLRKRNPDLPYGTLSAHVRVYLEKLPPNEAVVIPVGTFDPESLRSTATAWMTTNWGKGAYMTSVSEDRTKLEVLRIDTDAEKNDA